MAAVEMVETAELEEADFAGTAGIAVGSIAVDKQAVEVADTEEGLEVASVVNAGLWVDAVGDFEVEWVYFDIQMPAQESHEQREGEESAGTSEEAENWSREIY